MISDHDLSCWRWDFNSYSWTFAQTVCEVNVYRCIWQCERQIKEAEMRGAEVHEKSENGHLYTAVKSDSVCQVDKQICSDLSITKWIMPCPVHQWRQVVPQEKWKVFSSMTLGHAAMCWPPRSSQNLDGLCWCTHPSVLTSHHRIFTCLVLLKDSLWTTLSRWWQGTTECYALMVPEEGEKLIQGSYVE